jgi:hypothetical protein
MRFSRVVVDRQIANVDVADQCCPATQAGGSCSLTSASIRSKRHSQSRLVLSGSWRIWRRGILATLAMSFEIGWRR